MHIQENFMKLRNPLRLLSRVLGFGLGSLIAVSALAGIREDSVALDAVYIPALAMTSAAQSDAGVADKARAAMQRLDARWPALRGSLQASLGGTPAQATSARKTIAAVETHIAGGRRAVARGDFKAAHEALEEVRLDLMKARTARGVDYFVDRLTAYHEPMEVLALAGLQLKPQDLTPTKRAALEKAFVEARALWRGIEQHLPLPTDYALDAARASQFTKGVADETVALTRLSDALRGNDSVALLKAAQAIKPPFARTFTAFGQNS
jgi:hypothetical protein